MRIQAANTRSASQSHCTPSQPLPFSWSFWYPRNLTLQAGDTNRQGRRDGTSKADDNRDCNFRRMRQQRSRLLSLCRVGTLVHGRLASQVHRLICLASIKTRDDWSSQLLLTLYVPTVRWGQPSVWLAIITARRWISFGGNPNAGNMTSMCLVIAEELTHRQHVKRVREVVSSSTLLLFPLPFLF